jgi:hypothetical protein
VGAAEVLLPVMAVDAAAVRAGALSVLAVLAALVAIMEELW